MQKKNLTTCTNIRTKKRTSQQTKPTSHLCGAPTANTKRDKLVRTDQVISASNVVLDI